MSNLFIVVIGERGQGYGNVAVTFDEDEAYETVDRLMTPDYVWSSGEFQLFKWDRWTHPNGDFTEIQEWTA